MKLRLLELRIGGSGYSLLPTPTVNGNYNKKGLSKNSGDGLATVVKLWPTPVSSDSYHSRNHMDSAGKLALSAAVHMYPTPTTGAGLCGGTGNFQQLAKLKESGAITEDERRNMAQGNGGTLNPTLVEWLMGFPLGWTEL
jgi:hypothetical protein